MTLLYAEFTQTDLQREFRAARSQPRHLVPPPKAATSPSASSPTSPAPFMHSKSLSMSWRCFGAPCPTPAAASAVLDRLANRLTKIAAELRKLAPE